MKPLVAQAGGPAEQAVIGPRAHPLAAALWVPDPSRGRRLIRRLVVLLLAIAGLLSLRLQVVALSAPHVYAKDFKQEYLLGRALLDGTNPYQPPALLAERYLPDATAYVLLHPVPHPPFVALLAAPLGLLDYPTAAALWLALELALLLALVRLLAAGQRVGLSAARALLASLVLLVWPPVWGDLLFGQFSTSLAVLTVGCWLAHRRQRGGLAGALLGLAIAIKLFPAILVGYFALRRRWRVVGWSLSVALAATLAGVVAVGADGLRAYLEAGLPAAVAWRRGEGNYSAVSAVWRLLAGSVSIAPLVDLGWLAGPLSLAVGVVVLLLAAWAVRRADDPDAEFGLALAAVLLASPVVWQHYLVLLAWPLWVLGRRLHAAGWPSAGTNRLLVAVVLVTVPPGLAMGLAASLGVALNGGTAAGPLPGPAGLPLLLLVAGPALLFWLLLRELSPERAGRGAAMVSLAGSAAPSGARSGAGAPGAG